MHSFGTASGAATATAAVRAVPLVLIADDDEDILTLVALRFRRSGLEVILARDGEEALELIQTRAPDAAVLDIAMPKLTGLEVVRRLRDSEATKAIPIVLLTARAGDKDVELGLAAGADEYVTKPFSPQDLYACVQSVLSTA
jgi:two-component system, OmpR family, phosphate regulon response regulator PhoB